MAKERYSEEIIEQIRNLIYLPDLVQKYTSLNKHSRGLCIFHTERNPRFYVNGKKGLWHCFGCGAGGDIFTFIMLAENLTFPNAIKLLAFEAGIRLPESNTIKQALREKWSKKKERLDWLNRLEELFKEYEKAIFGCFKVDMRFLPPKGKWTTKDYLQKLLIEQDFDRLDTIIEKRKKLFEEERRRIRIG